MIQTFEELCQELKLTKSFIAEEILTKLQQWCFTHISQDMRFDGSKEEQYAEYYAYVEKYFHFLSQIPKDLSQAIPSFDNLNAIQYASLEGYHYFLKDYLTPSNVNLASSYLMTPLHFAATSGHLHTVDTLLHAGASPLTLNLQNEPPIFRALFLPVIYRENSIEQKKVIFQLLAHTAPETINMINDDGDNILHLIAVHNVFAPLIQDISQKHPELPFQLNNHGYYPIHMAILNDAAEVIQFLLQIPGMADVRGPEGRYPIHLAARNPNPFMIHECLKANKNLINMQDRTSKTPLLLAAEVGNIQGVAALIDAGADPRIKDFRNLSIADYAINFNHIELQKWLISHGLMSASNKLS